MNNWFECKVRYEKTMENGMLKKVTEPYLVDALSFTEAEARIIKEITPFISGEFTVSDIKRAKYTEIFEDPTGDRWYRCKVLFITLDEKSGAEKKTACSMLVQAPDINVALQNLIKGMQGTMADYQIAAITETPLMDVLPYAAMEEETKPVTSVGIGEERIQEILKESPVEEVQPTELQQEDGTDLQEEFSVEIDEEDSAVEEFVAIEEPELAEEEISEEIPEEEI